MKRIVYLTFYFEPDLCAGSFRNSPLATELARQAKAYGATVDVFTTLPNRYSTFSKEAPFFEQRDNMTIHRIALPPHQSGMADQIKSFRSFYNEVLRLNKGKKADLVFASSSRLFTAYLGHRIAKKMQAPLYLDIRDIFVDTIGDVLKSKVVKSLALPILKRIERQIFNGATHINLISGGFKPYFKQFRCAAYSAFSNGIDDEFLNRKPLHDAGASGVKTIVYAGNIGEGQGLHKIVPQAAKELGEGYRFVIIGDGGVKKMLEAELQRLGVTNVELRKPVDRKQLIEEYERANFLFLHLNDYPAFKKVLPSKIFELATFQKPILAGVGGYAQEFINREVPGSFVFDPCDVAALVQGIREFNISHTLDRSAFIHKYRRENINTELSRSILNLL